MKRLLLLSACVLALSACQTAQPMGAKPASNQTKAEAAPVAGSTSTTITTTNIPSDPNVQVYSTTGPAMNPLVTDRTHNVLDNTTAGGYTVFDDSVTVYPLPGEEVPSFVPSYTVPPLDKQYQAAPPMVGQQPLGLASAGMLPPVKNVDVPDVPDANPYSNPPVPGAVRQPLTLTAPTPTTMPPPVSASPAPRSPFAEPGEAKTATPKTDMNAGRRSGPLLTGY